jgi:hypothetical protein
MRKIAAILLLFVIAAAGNLIGLAQANFLVYWPWVPDQPVTDQPTVTISPRVNNSLVGEDLSLNFTVGIPDSWYYHRAISQVNPLNGQMTGTTVDVYTFIGTIAEVKCSVDETVFYDNNTIFGGPTYEVRDSSVNITSTPSYSVPIGSLPLGSHSVVISVSASTVWNTAKYQHYDVSMASANTLMVCTLPTVINVSVQNTNYNSSVIPLTFELNDTLPMPGYSWIGFSLDNSANVTITGNSTLTGLEEGNHSLVVYANDTFGNMGKSDTAYFAVSLPAPTPSPTPTPSASEAPSASVPEFPTWVAVSAFVSTSFLVPLAIKRKTKFTD